MPSHKKVKPKVVEVSAQKLYDALPDDIKPTAIFLLRLLNRRNHETIKAKAEKIASNPLYDLEDRVTKVEARLFRDNLVYQGN